MSMQAEHDLGCKNRKLEFGSPTSRAMPLTIGKRRVTTVTRHAGCVAVALRALAEVRMTCTELRDKIAAPMMLRSLHRQSGPEPRLIRTKYVPVELGSRVILFHAVNHVLFGVRKAAGRQGVGRQRAETCTIFVHCSYRADVSAAAS